MSKADLIKKYRGFACLFAVFVFAATAHADLGGVKGKYSDWLDELLRSKSYEALVKDPSPQNPEPVTVTCLDTPGDKYYIGVVQNMRVKASLEKLRAVVEDFGSYDQLFPDYAKINVVSREGNRVLTFWENKIPVFFIPNVRYRHDLSARSERPEHENFSLSARKKGQSYRKRRIHRVDEAQRNRNPLPRSGLFRCRLGHGDDFRSGPDLARQRRRLLHFRSRVPPQSRTPPLDEHRVSKRGGKNS